MESLGKSLFDFGQHSHASFSSRVYWSISSCLAAFIIAYIDFKNGGLIDGVVFSCSFMAIFAGWCAWVLIGVDTRIMKTVEVMKSFEVTRLAARIINPLTIWPVFA